MRVCIGDLASLNIGASMYTANLLVALGLYFSKAIIRLVLATFGHFPDSTYDIYDCMTDGETALYTPWYSLYNDILYTFRQ